VSIFFGAVRLSARTLPAADDVVSDGVDVWTVQPASAAALR